MSAPAILAAGLAKSYGAVRVLRDRVDAAYPRFSLDSGRKAR